MPLAIPDEAAKMPWRCCGVKGLWGSSERRSQSRFRPRPSSSSQQQPAAYRTQEPVHLPVHRMVSVGLLTILVHPTNKHTRTDQRRGRLSAGKRLPIDLVSRRKRPKRRLVEGPASSSSFPWARGPVFITTMECCPLGGTGNQSRISNVGGST